MKIFAHFTHTFHEYLLDQLNQLTLEMLLGIPVLLVILLLFTCISVCILMESLSSMVTAVP